jgi:hypothetical protein
MEAREGRREAALHVWGGHVRGHERLMGEYDEELARHPISEFDFVV